MKKLLVILLIGMLMMSSLSFATPKEMRDREISNRVIVFEAYNQPADGQNTVCIKFPKLGELEELTVERIRMPERDNKLTDYLADSDFDIWEGGYDTVLDDQGSEWIVMDFYYTRENVHQYRVEGKMSRADKHHTYSFSYDSAESDRNSTNSRDREMKEIHAKFVVSESEEGMKDNQSKVRVKFPKIGRELTRLSVTRNRIEGLSRIVSDYMSDDDLESWEGGYEIVVEEDQEFVVLTFVYTHENIVSFDIQVEMTAGKSGVTFGSTYVYTPEHSPED